MASKDKKAVKVKCHYSWCDGKAEAKYRRPDGVEGWFCKEHKRGDMIESLDNYVEPVVIEKPVEGEEQ